MSAEGLIRDETGTQRTLGYVLDVSAGDGCARCHLTVDARHTNRHGALHGGIVACMLDNAMGATGSLSVDETGRWPMVTLSMTTNFLASAQVGDALTATGRVTGGGRSIRFIDGELRGADGRLIATGTGTFKPLAKERRP